MAVRADDIALGRFGKDARGPRSTDQTRDADAFPVGIQMVEVHRARREPAAAVDARAITKLIEEPAVFGPATTTLVEASRCPHRRSEPQALAVLGEGPDAVADRTHDVALRELGEQALHRRAERRAARQAERLGRRIAMVLVHLVRRERSAAVRAGDHAQRAKQRQTHGLPRSDAGDLELTIPSVVRHVRSPLVSTSGHDPTIEHAFAT